MHAITPYQLASAHAACRACSRPTRLCWTWRGATGPSWRRPLAARLAPSMMGGDGPRTYIMGFQTNAEARGTGGR